MTIPGRRSLWATLALSTLLLGGCRSAYSVDINNDSPEPLRARLVRDDGGGRSTILAETRIAPRDRINLAKYDAPKNWLVSLSLDKASAPGDPRVVNVPAGVTRIHAATDAAGRLSLQIVED